MLRRVGDEKTDYQEWEMAAKIEFRMLQLPTDFVGNLTEHCVAPSLEQ